MTTFTVIRQSGEAEVYRGHTYWEVLNGLYSDHLTGGSNYDYPVSLFKDGKLVVADGLSDIAWKVGRESAETIAAARALVQQRNMPEWLT